MPVSSSTEHWIKPDALTINLNHFGDPDYLQVSVLAGAVVMAFKQDVIGYNAAHNYRTWPLDAANTYLETSSAYNVYARLTRSEVNARALVVYDTVLRDIEGREITYSEDGSEVLGEANPDFFFAFLGQISASVNSNGESVQREWTIDFRAGNLDTNQYRNEESAGEWSKMFRLNKVTDLIEVLKTISSAVINKLTVAKELVLFGKYVVDVKRSTDTDEDVSISDETIPTTKYVKESTEDKFLRKDQPDTAREVITFEKGLNVGEFVSGASGASFFKDLTTGQTIMELDKLYVRMKAFFETLTIVEAQTISGKQIISPAGSVRCTNVEEYDDYYRCYFLNEQDGEKIENKFIVGDQAYSQMFNAKTGTTNKISNRYYWRLVMGVGENYIDLSKTDCDADSDAPMVGDVLNQRGHRYPENSERMNFIETSTVDGFSPSITLFHGVNSFSLAGKAYVQFGVDKTTNKAFMHVYGDMYVGDRNQTAYIRYTHEDGLEICGKLAVGTKLGDKDLQELIDSATPEGYQEFVEKVTQDLAGLQSQIDGTIDSYFFQYEPSLDNYPASEWDTESEKKAHLNDTFTNLVDGRSWRWSLDGTYKWVEITDTATTKALALAGKAQDTADGKRRVFVVTDEHPTPYPPYDKGDLWSRGSDYPLLICVVPKESGVYAEGDFDYADNNAKLKEEMQTLVTNTKDELNNSIGQAKEAANKYADEGIASAKEDINASIAELEEAKANVTEVYSKSEADGKITEAETSAINAAKAQADAAIALSEVTIKAYADGIVDDEEAARIKQAQENLAEAKRYAEEQAEAAKSEIENSYLFQALQDAQSTEIENGLVLTSLIQLRDTQSNIMSGINGLINASKGDKSIATWWGGDMLDLIDYYRWDGSQWVVKSGITAPSNIPSGLIRMDGTGYLAKGKFWWDNDGKIYADPTALFLSFDVDAEEGTLSATILDIRDKQTEFANMWSLQTDSNGTKYLYSKYPLVSQGGVTMYAGTSGLDVEGIYDGLPIDGSTIYWENGVLKAQGGGGGVADSVAWADITGKPSFATVATSGSYNDLLNKPTLLSSFTNDLGFVTESALSGYQPLITSTNKLAYSLISGTPTIPTSLKSPYALTFGSKTYDGSAAKTITASDLGALTAHQTIYNLRMQAGAFSAVTFDPNGAAKTVNIPTTTSHISEGTNLYFTNARAVSALSSTLSGYLTLTGGTLTGKLTINTSSYGNQLEIYRNQANGNSAIRFSNSEKVLGDIGVCGSGGEYPYQPLFNDRVNTYQIYHSGNLTKLSQLTNDSGFITSSASISGNAATATKLATARTIWGQSFDGTGNITGGLTDVSSIQTTGAAPIYLYKDSSKNGHYIVCDHNGFGISKCEGQVWKAMCLNINYDTNNVAIGQVANSYKFHVNGTLNATTIYQNGSSLDSLLGTKLNSSSYTAADVLAKLKTVDGSGSGLDADTLDGVQLSGYYGVGARIFRKGTCTANLTETDDLDVLTYANDKLGYYTTNDNVLPKNAPTTNFGALCVSINTGYTGQLLFAYGNRGTLWYRNQYYAAGNHVWSSWGQLAFTDSNVASATKLQTPRTIWGQSFDGTGDVNGILTINSGGYIVAKDGNGNNRDVLELSTDNTFYLGYGSAGAGGTTYLLGNNIAFRYGTSRTEGMRITSSGNVGIGTASPAYKLDVNGTFNAAKSVRCGSTLYMNGTANGIDASIVFARSHNYIILPSESTFNFAVETASSANTKLRIAANGNVGIGTTSPSHKLHVEGYMYATHCYIGASSYGQGNIELLGDTPYIDFHHKSSTADYTTRLIEGLSGQLTCTGKFRIGLGYTTSTDYNFYVRGSAYISSNLLTGGGITMYSQRSLKNVVDEDGLSLNELSVIKPTRYTWKDKRDERLHIGGIADDIQQVLPEVVYRTPDGVLTMDYGNAAFAIASSLIKPMIEHESEIVSLKRRVRELEEEVKRLRA